MKKLLCCLIAAALLLLAAGCGQTVTVKGNSLLSDGEVKSIRVSSAPEEYDFEFRSAEDTQKIINYLTGLNLIDEFEENPEEYNGMTWIIKIAYSDNREQTIYHFGNKFIRSDNGSWSKMDYKEAEQFEKLLPINNE